MTTEKKISELSAISQVDVTSGDIIPIVDDGTSTTEKITIGQIYTFVSESLNYTATASFQTVSASYYTLSSSYSTLSGSYVTTSGSYSTLSGSYVTTSGRYSSLSGSVATHISQSGNLSTTLTFATGSETGVVYQLFIISGSIISASYI